MSLDGPENDLCVYLDENNSIHYCGYTKPTDAKLYKPNSFKPMSVFNSIPFSQMLRTLRNKMTHEIELKQCISYFEPAVTSQQTWLKWKKNQSEKQTQSALPKQNQRTLWYSLYTLLESKPWSEASTTPSKNWSTTQDFFSHWRKVAL